MVARRVQRVNELIREIISELLSREVMDPRLRGIISVTEVDTSPDLRNAKVYISVLGSEEEKKQVEEGLAAATKFIRRGLGERISLRNVPELSFKRDDSIERGSRLLNLIAEVAPRDDTDEVGQD